MADGQVDWGTEGCQGLGGWLSLGMTESLPVVVVCFRPCYSAVTPRTHTCYLPWLLLSSLVALCSLFPVFRLYRSVLTVGWVIAIKHGLDVCIA